MSVGTQNLTTDIKERQYSAYRETSPVPPWFRHKQATYTGPTLIVFPGTLTAQEQLEVSAWLAAAPTDRPNVLAKCTQRAAIAKIAEYVAYYANATFLLWQDTDNGVRLAEWRLWMADALILSKATISPSSDSAGTGSGAISGPFSGVVSTPD